MAVDRTGIDAGQDVDGDGINETVSLYAVTVLRVEDVSVPIGTFRGALRVETTTQATETESKTGVQFTSTETRVDWYAASVGPIKRSWNTGARTYDYELVAYSVGGVSRGVLPTWRAQSLADLNVVHLYLDAIALRVRSAGRVTGNLTHVKAELKIGELTVLVPKATAAVPKRIPVASGNKPQA